MSELYFIANGPAPTTAAQAAHTTTVAIETLLQVKMGPTMTNRAKVVEWGISFNGSAAATPIACELFANSAAATVTAHVAAGIVNLDPHAEATLDLLPFDWGTAATGYDASAEGTPASVRMMDVQFVAPVNQYVKQWPLGREPEFDPDEYLRVRITAGATTWTCYTYVVIEV